MWVKRTTEEIAAAKRRERMGRIKLGILLGLICFVISLFKYTKGEFVQSGQWFVSFKNISARIPMALFYGVAMAGAGYFIVTVFPNRGYVCPKCGKVKAKDGIRECVCGGNFEDMDVMKWRGPVKK